MQMTTTGLVLREVKTGESDRIITILTPKLGIISAIAKGSLRLKNKLFSSTGLFCYSEFTLFEGKTMFVVDEAEVKDLFFGIRQSVEGMALAMYFAELAVTLAPQDGEAENLLRLILNCFYFASEKKRDYKQIKNIYELRALCGAGFMPDLVACEKCAKYEGGSFYFNTEKANILCADCAAQAGQSPNLPPSALAAMRHIVFSEDARLFSFTVSQDAINALDYAVTQYLSACIDHPLKTLDFLKSALY